MSIESTIIFKEGDVIYREGESATHLYFLQKGSVEGRIGEHRVDINEGQVTGDGGIVSGIYKATVLAGPEGCTLLKMPIDQLRDELANCSPLVRLFVVNLLGRQEIVARLLKGTA